MLLKKGTSVIGSDRRRVLLLFNISQRKEQGGTGGDRRGVLLLFNILEKGTRWNRR